MNEMTTPIPLEIHECPELLDRNLYYDSFYDRVAVLRDKDKWYCGPLSEAFNEIKHCSACGVRGVPAVTCCPFCGIKLAKHSPVKKGGAAK